MHSLKTFFLATALVFMLFLSGCAASTEDLATEVRSSIEEKVKAEGIKVEDFSLSHKGGNEYKGILETKEANGNFTYAVDVVYDGNTFTWEIAD